MSTPVATTLPAAILSLLFDCREFAERYEPGSLIRANYERGMSVERIAVAVGRRRRSVRRSLDRLAALGLVEATAPDYWRAVQ